jgi:hypothetical protein
MLIILKTAELMREKAVPEEAPDSWIISEVHLSNIFRVQWRDHYPKGMSFSFSQVIKWS